MKRKRNMFLILILILSFKSQATPKKYTNCPVMNEIIAPPIGSGFYMNKACNTAYILPPVVGEVDFGSMVTELTSQSCQGTESVVNYIESKLLEFEKMRVDIVKGREKIISNNIELQKIQKECKGFSKKQFGAEKKLTKFKKRVTDFEQKYLKLKDKKEECLSQNSQDENFRCNFLGLKVSDLEQKLSKAEDIIGELVYEREAAEIDVKFCHKELALELEYMAKLSPKSPISEAVLDKNILAYRKKLNELIGEEAQARGGIMGINIFSGYEALRSEFVRLNSHLEQRVQFVKIPLKSSQISFQMIVDGVKSGYPVILKSMITGLDMVQKNKSLMNSVLEVQGEAMVEKVFGEGIGGNIVLNRLAVCQMVREKKLNDPENLTVEDIASLVRPTASYEYELEVDRRIKIAYSESHFYQLIRKATKKKSGLFKTKTLNSLFQKSEADKWIDIEFMSEDGDHAFTDQITMAHDIRQEYAQAALMKVARGYLNRSQISLLDGGKTAAKGAATEIKKCKNYYCQAAGIVLDIADSLFSGSAQEANMTSIVRAMEKIKITDIKTVKHAGTLAFEEKR